MSPDENEEEAADSGAGGGAPDSGAGGGAPVAEAADEAPEEMGSQGALADGPEAPDAPTAAPPTTPSPAPKAPSGGARPVPRPGAPRPGQARGGRPVARTAQGRAVQAAKASGAAPKTPPAPKPTPSKTPRPAAAASTPKAPKAPDPTTEGETARPKDARERRAREIERRKAAAAAAAKAKRKRQVITFSSTGVGVVLLVVLIVVLAGGGGGTPANTKVSTANIPSSTVLSPTPATTAGPETVPVPVGSALAPINASLTGQTTDGITCGAESVVYHIHVHLTLFVNGEAKQVPYGIGIVNPKTTQGPGGAPFVNNGQCYYWIHTHAADGIIHVETPENKTFSLGNFFDLWGQPLSMTQVGPASGPVTIYYNGKLFTGSDPRSIPLEKHGEIQIEVGTPLVAPARVDNWGNL